ncbi:MAG: 2Fe-2S iron-sulfur cluster-binding protein [Gemmatimonadota bacterium]
MENSPTTTVTLTIDGREVTVPKGTTLLQAAQTIGIEVPHYCYHPGLTAPAQCRLCLVEVEGAPKLAASCVTEAGEGQVVRTQSEPATEMRRGVLEFYLANHPLDCPICDQSGECKLQDYVHAEGREHGRSREPKRVFGRDDFGGDVLFYGDRCVMCTRCVRFMNEKAQDPRLTVVERGNRSIIDTFFAEGVEGSPYSGNIVDICPVGALVSKDFLHKARAWDLDHTPSICPNCSQGCNIDLHTRDNLIQRMKPRDNPEVNEHWICDYGRARYEWPNRPDRIEAPFVRQGDGQVAASWEDALEALDARLSAAQGPVRAVASPFAANEDLAGLAILVDALGGGEIVFRSSRAEAEIPLPGFETLARRRDLVPNRKGAELFGMTRVGGDDATGGIEALENHEGTVIVLGDDLAEFGASFGAHAGLYVYLGSHAPSASTSASFVLPITTFAEQEGTFTNHVGRVQRFWPALRAPELARPAWAILGRLAGGLRGGAGPSAPDEAFLHAAEIVPEFEGLTYDVIGAGGAATREPAALPGS